MISSCRTPEVVYQPSLVGIDQAGITETTQFVLKHFSPDEQQILINVSLTVSHSYISYVKDCLLSQNVFITGGNTMVLNFKERLEVELLAVRPFQSKFSVSVSSKVLSQVVGMFVTHLVSGICRRSDIRCLAWSQSVGTERGELPHGIPDKTRVSGNGWRVFERAFCVQSLCAYSKVSGSVDFRRQLHAACAVPPGLVVRRF